MMDALEYGQFSVEYIWAGLLGADYLQKLWIWTLLLLSGYGITLAVSCFLLLGIVFLRSRSRAETGRLLLLPLLVSVFQIGLALAIISSTSLQVKRYPLPLLGYLALIVGVSLMKIGKTWLASTVLAIFFAQLALANLSSYGYLEHPLWGSRTLQTRPARDLELVEAISQIATGEREKRVGLATSGLGIYSYQVSYHLSKKGGALAAASPEYNSVEFLLSGPDMSANVDAVWEKIEAEKPAYMVLLNDTLRHSQRDKWAGSPLGWGAIMCGAVDISERVIESADYKPVELSSYPELAVYRRAGTY